MRRLAALAGVLLSVGNDHVAPCSAYRRQMARPNPLAPPVTTATLSSSSVVMRHLSSQAHIINKFRLVLVAWVGDVDTTSKKVNVRTKAGTKGYLDDMQLAPDSDGHSRVVAGLSARGRVRCRRRWRDASAMPGHPMSSFDREGVGPSNSVSVSFSK